MLHRRLLIALFLIGLSPGVALSRDLCIQLDDDGDAIVLRKVKVKPGSASVGGHYANFRPGTLDFEFAPVTAGVVVVQNKIAIGFTQYAERVTNTSTGGGVGGWVHSFSCAFGADGRLGPLDSCGADTQVAVTGGSNARPAHVVDCIDAYYPE
jgi:hypothetical protein